MDAAKNKEEKLKALLESFGSVVVAFSGGVDSSYLLKIAHDCLGENAVAVTARSCSYPKRELEAAKKFCAERKIEHIVIESEELDIDGFACNPTNRCYLCKNELFTKIKKLATEKLKAAGGGEIIEGTNASDEGDYRPGLQAIAEHKIRSPLKEVGMTKEEIRHRSKTHALPTADKPALACLSSRFPYGEEITREKLSMIEAAEDYLLATGFTNVRVRLHKTLARIELPENEIETAAKQRNKISEKLKSLGFDYVSLDLGGYKMGSMNTASDILL
jgi:uncharacterized protein